MVYRDTDSGFKYVCLFINTFDKVSRSTLYSFFIFILALILIGIVAAFGREGYGNYQLNKEISGLKKEIESLKKNNDDLSNLANYYNSEKSLEEEARLKLNLMKEGEKLVVISPEGKAASESQSRSNIEKKRFSNLDKWLGYLGFDKDFKK